MKKYQTIIIITTSTLILFLFIGCASSLSAFNYNPNPIQAYAGPSKNTNDISLIRGQAYAKSWGDFVQVTVKEVDGKSVYNPETSLRIPYIIYITPGKHELTVYGGFGSAAGGYEHNTLPKISVEVQPGQAYQLLIDTVTEQNGRTSVSYKLAHIGSIDQYTDYLARNSDYQSGHPMQPGTFK